MKLIYQWLIVLALAGILWLMHIQAGGALGKLASCLKAPASSATITQNIIVAPRQSSINPADLPRGEHQKEESKEDAIPGVETTPPSKNKKRLKVIITRESHESLGEWDFSQKEERMVQ